MRRRDASSVTCGCEHVRFVSPVARGRLARNVVCVQRVRQHVSGKAYGGYSAKAHPKSGPRKDDPVFIAPRGTSVVIGHFDRRRRGTWRDANSGAMIVWRYTDALLAAQSEGLRATIPALSVVA